MKFISKITVNPIQQCGGDSMVVAAAKVSTSGEEALQFKDSDANFGLINFLMTHRHGTPFEHGFMTFFVHAPIFVFREWHRHRIGMSYNEESGRYKTLDPVFWIPGKSRPMVPINDPGDECTNPHCKRAFVERKPLCKIENGLKRCPLCQNDYRYNVSARPLFKKIEEDDEYNFVVNVLKESYIASYNTYTTLVNFGVAKEVSRAALPVGIYSSCWVSTNPRALMHFLSLRTHDEKAKYISYPQTEIEEAARQAEIMLQKGWPITYRAFMENGRVGP